MDTELLLYPFPVDNMFSATQMNVPEIDLYMFVKLRVTPVWKVVRELIDLVQYTVVAFGTPCVNEQFKSKFIPSTTDISSILFTMGGPENKKLVVKGGCYFHLKNRITKEV